MDLEIRDQDMKEEYINLNMEETVKKLGDFGEDYENVVAIFSYCKC